MTVNKLNIKDMENWKVGDKVFAKKLQQPVSVLKALGGVTPPQQFINSGKSIQMKQFKVVRLDTDVIICHTFNGVEEGEDEIKVAMPFLLRKTPFDSATRLDPPRAGITYVYSDFNIRVATNEDDEDEAQILVDSYEEGDIIFAMKGIFGGTSLYHDEEKEIPVIWIDSNVDGRFWALDIDAEEEETT